MTSTFEKSEVACCGRNAEFCSVDADVCRRRCRWRGWVTGRVAMRLWEGRGEMGRLSKCRWDEDFLERWRCKSQTLGRPLFSAQTSPDWAFQDSRGYGRYKLRPRRLFTRFREAAMASFTFPVLLSPAWLIQNVLACEGKVFGAPSLPDTATMLR